MNETPLRRPSASTLLSQHGSSWIVLIRRLANTYTAKSRITTCSPIYGVQGRKRKRSCRGSMRFRRVTLIATRCDYFCSECQVQQALRICAHIKASSTPISSKRQRAEVYCSTTMSSRTACEKPCSCKCPHNCETHLSKFVCFATREIQETCGECSRPTCPKTTVVIWVQMKQQTRLISKIL